MRCHSSSFTRRLQLVTTSTRSEESVCVPELMRTTTEVRLCIHDKKHVCGTPHVALTATHTQTHKGFDFVSLLNSCRSSSMRSSTRWFLVKYEKSGLNFCSNLAWFQVFGKNEIICCSLHISSLTVWLIIISVTLWCQKV